MFVVADDDQAGLLLAGLAHLFLARFLVLAQDAVLKVEVTLHSGLTAVTGVLGMSGVTVPNQDTEGENEEDSKNGEKDEGHRPSTLGSQPPGFDSYAVELVAGRGEIPIIDTSSAAQVVKLKGWLSTQLGDKARVGTCQVLGNSYTSPSGIITRPNFLEF